MRARRAWLAAAVVAGLGCRSMPQGREESFRTSSLPSPASYSVFLPPSYETSPGRRYPVLYFLHDAFGHRNVLFREGVTRKLSAAMSRGEIPEFLVVCPEGDHSWFSDSHDGRRLYETMVTSDLPRKIERRYRVRPGRASRAITGISMGGYGAVKAALRHPDLYGAVSSLSGALIPLGWNDVEQMPWLVRRQLHRIFGRSESDNSLAENDVWRLLDARPRWRVGFEVFLLAGTHDKYRLDRVALQYAEVLNRHGIRALARVEPGAHDWSYWSRAFLEIARWHGERFEENSANR
jgi:putative tributyrin esterase